jgi:hypothetical protein
LCRSLAFEFWAANLRDVTLERRFQLQTRDELATEQEMKLYPREASSVSGAYLSGIHRRCAPWRDTRRARFQVSLNVTSIVVLPKNQLPLLHEWIDFDDLTVYF